MIERKLFLFLLFIFFSLSTTAQQRFLYIGEEGKVNFRSDAPQEIIRATSGKLKGVIDPEKKTFAFRLPIRSFEGFNSPMQREHFNEKYLESDKYPDAFFTGKIIEDVDLRKDGTFDVRAKGKFVLHGVENERIIRSTVIVKDGIAEVVSGFSILLNDHNIKVPKIVHEKVASEIAIDIRIRMKKK